MHRLPVCGIGLLALAAALVGCGDAKLPEQPAPTVDTPAVGVDTPKLKDQTRMPWTVAESGFIRKWLVCGTFPNPPHAGGQYYDHTPPCVGIATDYLADLGGEATVRPAAGMTVKTPGGGEVKWVEHVSDDDRLNLQALFSGQPTDNRVAYAAATIHRKTAGKAVLSIGSDDGVRVWLNGKVVHDILIGRGAAKDADLAPVTLKAGANTVLAKVENGSGGWGLYLRIISEAQAASANANTLRPRIEPAPRGEPGLLLINTDVGGTFLADPHDVRVAAVAAGGKVLADVPDAKRGDVVRLKTEDWPAGPCEIRLSKATFGGVDIHVHLPWYVGDWRKQAAELMVEADAHPVDSDEPKAMVYRLLKDFLIARLGVDPRSPTAELTDADLAKVHNLLLEHAELRDGSATRPHGFVRLAWRDPVDGSAQFARAFLPAKYDPQRQWPMIVNLHGYNPSNPEYVDWGGYDRRHNNTDHRDESIILFPHGRSNTGYVGIGEADVLRAIRLAKDTLSVDDDRVYLMGYSMGGGGTWAIGTRNPEVFAAIAPIFGGWDYHVWSDEESLAKLTDRRRFEMGRRSSFAHAESLLTTPVFVNHGDSDDLVEVEHSRYAVKMLQRWGYKVRYWEHPGKGHGRLGCEPELMSWFAAHLRNANPSRVRVRSGFLKDAKAHWVRVEQSNSPSEYVHVDARVLNPSTISLHTANALQVRLSPGPALIDRAKPVRVIWNGRDAGTHGFTDGAITLRAPGYTPWKLHKTPLVAGPISDVKTTPFAIVVGTAAKDQAMRRFCQMRAEAERDQWATWQHVTPRFFLDTEITDEQIRAYSLRLYGGPDQNLVARKLAKQIPLTVTTESVTVAGQKFPATDAAVGIVYPHPLNPERYVSITAATSPTGMYYAHHLPDNVDFAIVRPQRWVGEPEWVPEWKLAVASGHFDHNWQYKEAFTDRGEPKLMAQTVPLAAPTRLTAAVHDKQLMLSELLEARVAGSFAHMGRNVNWQGKPITLGGKTYANGIAASYWHEPCTVNYDLAGGNWRRLRATIGIEVDNPEKLEIKQKQGTRIYLVVRGDGKELYRSPTFGWNARPVEMNVDVTGVKDLQLEVANERTWHSAASSVNWADLRLEK